MAKEYDNAMGFEGVVLDYRLVKVWTYGIVFVSIGIVAVAYDYTVGYECQHLHVRGRRVNVVASSMREAICLICLVFGPVLGQVFRAVFSGGGQELRPYGDPYYRH